MPATLLDTLHAISARVMKAEDALRDVDCVPALVAFDLTELDTLTREAKEHLTRGGAVPEELEAQVGTKLEIVSAAVGLASRALKDGGHEMHDRLHESLGIINVAVRDALTRYTRLKG
jgi:hypothetical protein